ncbi:MAG: MFS transporter [Brevundimonas sp.]
MFRFDRQFRAELRENWFVLVIAFCCFLFGFAAPAFALPFIYPEVINEFGWTREQATLLASSKYAVGAAAAIVAGRVVDVIGAWVSLIVTISLGGLALLAFLWVDSLAANYMIGILLGCAAGGTMVSLKVLISRAFNASQGSAMGIALIGTVVGSIILPFFVVYATEAWNWRTAIASLSAGIWLVAIPLLVLGLFSKSMAFGRRIRVSDRIKVATEDSLRHIMRERRFWIIGAGVFLVGMVDQAFMQHQVLIFNDAGIPRDLIAAGVSALGVAGIVARMLVGNILDGTSNRGLAFLWATLSVSVLLAFFLINPLIFMAFIITRAIGHSAVLLDTTVMTKHVYGPKKMGTLLGFYTALVSAGFAVGPWLMGRLYDMSDSYASSFILFAILPLIASVLIWGIRPDYWLAQRASSAAPREKDGNVAREGAKL